MDKEYSQKLKALRGDRTIEEVAKAVDISPSSLGMYETGRRVPRDDVKIRLARYYETTVAAIFF